AARPAGRWKNPRTAGPSASREENGSPATPSSGRDCAGRFERAIEADPPRAASTAPRGLDRRRESFHSLQALAEILAPEIEDQLAHAEGAIRPDVLRDLIGRARERAPLPARHDR